MQRNLFAILLLAFLASACAAKKAQKDATINPFFKKINISASTASVLTTATTQANIGAVSLRIPIRGLVLENSSTGARDEIYRCAADSNDPCLVELANTQALTDLLAIGAVSAKAGTFDTMLVYHCISEAGYTSFVNTTVSVGTLTYYTHANGDFSTNEIDAAAIPIQSTGCLSRHKLPTPITFIEKQTVNLSMYFDPRDMVWVGFTKTSAGWFASGCSGDINWDGTPDAAFVCVSSLDVTATVSAITPVVERYKVNDLAIIGLYFNGDGTTSGDGTLMGGYARRFYAVDVDPNGFSASSLFTPTQFLKTLILNSDATLGLETYGETVDSPAYFSTSAFKRGAVGDTSSGQFTTSVAGFTGAYTAKRID